VESRSDERTVTQVSLRMSRGFGASKGARLLLESGLLRGSECGI
jgi:hypothetical protein